MIRIGRFKVRNQCAPPCFGLTTRTPPLACKFLSWASVNFLVRVVPDIRVSETPVIILPLVRGEPWPVMLAIAACASYSSLCFFLRISYSACA